MQSTPHTILLDNDWYHKELKPLLAHWVLLFLRSKKLSPLQDRYLLSYLTNGPVADPEAASAVKVALDDEYMKLVNLSHDLLRTFMPHLLGKIDRVSFGLLSPNDLKLAIQPRVTICYYIW